MRSQLQKLMALAALLAALLSNGFHVAVFQGIAWTRMYADYQERLPPLEAIERTLSGKELCGLCQLSLDLRDQAEDAAVDYHTTPNIPLLLAPAEVSLLASSQSRRLPFIIPLGRMPRQTIIDTDPPPPKAGIA